MKNITVANLLRRVHRDEAGSVSLETLLIICSVALPMLIFLLKFGWPRVRDLFTNGTNSLEQETNNVINGK